MNAEQLQASILAKAAIHPALDELKTAVRERCAADPGLSRIISAALDNAYGHGFIDGGIESKVAQL